MTTHISVVQHIVKYIVPHIYEMLISETPLKNTQNAQYFLICESLSCIERAFLTANET